MTLRRTLLIAPFIAGCSVLPDRPFVDTRRYPLEPRRQGAPRSGRARRSLLVRTLRPGAGMETRNLRTIRPDGTEHLDYYAEWTAPPADAAEQALRRWLLDSRLFSAILAPGTRVSQDFALEGEMTRLEAVQGEGVARAELAVVLIDDRQASRLVGQMVTTGTAPLAGGTAEPTPDQAAAAMSAALGHALTSLEQALVRFA